MREYFTTVNLLSVTRMGRRPTAVKE